MVFICLYRYVWGERPALAGHHFADLPNHSPRRVTNEHHASIGIGIPMHNLSAGMGQFPIIPGLQPPYMYEDGVLCDTDNAEGPCKPDS